MNARRLEWLAVFGVAAGIFYVAHVVAGSLLWPGYSQLMQPISDLTSLSAPHREIALALSVIYGFCSVLCAIGLVAWSRELKIGLFTAGTVVLLAMELVSLSYGLFPEDIPGTPQSTFGFMHIVVTGALVPLTIASPLLIGLGLRKRAEFRSYGVYSIVTSVWIFVFGGASGVFFAQGLPYFGLVERLNIGALIIWIMVLSLKFVPLPTSRRT